MTRAPDATRRVGDKPAAYHAHERDAFLDWVDGQYGRVLDVGCGSGANAAWYRRHGASEIVGVELDPESAAVAATVFDRVLTARIETALDNLDGSFDLIVCADVLEHLVDPGASLRALTRVASARAVLAVSIPNVQFLGAVIRIAVRGFRYEDEGIFDRTHLRFFGRSDVEQLLSTSGWEPERWGAAVYGPLRGARILAGRVSAGRSNRWLAEQLYVTARLGSRTASG